MGEIFFVLTNLVLDVVLETGESLFLSLEETLVSDVDDLLSFIDLGLLPVESVSFFFTLFSFVGAFVLVLRFSFEVELLAFCFLLS